MQPLTADKIAVLDSDIKRTSLALASLLQTSKEEPINGAYVKTLLSLIEMTMASVSRHLGVATQTQVDVDERFSEIYKANGRIRELEGQLGEAMPIDSLAQSVGVLERKFQGWWKASGFGHTIDFMLTGHGAKIVLSGSLFGEHWSTFSETPISDKESRALWVASLIDQGYALAGMDNFKLGGDPKLIDCDGNRALIIKLITGKFPSAIITGITNYGQRNNLFVLRQIEVTVRDLREIDCLTNDDDDR